VIGERVVIDTDVASMLLRGSLPAGLTASLAGAELCVTFVTVGELHRGAAHARWGARRIGALEAWLARLTAIPGDRAVARRWGELTGHGLTIGRPLPANDAWIAACCLTHGVGLATLNRRDYDSIEELRLVSAYGVLYDRLR
jgi:predicted nucleic acid-binding protein